MLKGKGICKIAATTIMIHYFIHLAVLGLTYDVQDLLCITQDLRSTQTPQLWPVGSVVVVHGLSCPVACGIFILQPGMEPMSPALRGGFLTTGPPGRSP